MSIKYIRCTRCGGDLTKKGEAYVCQYCNVAFVEDFISQNEKIIAQFLDELKLEKVSALRQQLYEKTHAKYLSRNEILETAKGIRSYLPEDFLARFYESACSKNKQDVIDFIQSIDYEYNYANFDLVIEFMIKNLNSENLLAVSNLIENAYKENNLELYREYTNEYEKEAEKIDKGIYERIIPRDVFIAYSSKDMKVVEEITQYLESQGITCFVALRNLRHGVGAVEDYDKALEEAIDNCKIFLYVSSKNSRNMACDALKKEITYVKRIDLKDAPIQYKNNYIKLPKKYKKPRIQLRLDNEETRIADKQVNEFFDGYEWCYDKETIIDRISDVMFNFDIDIEAKPSNTDIKYCVNCKKELPIEAKFCIDCGSSEFANSVKELFETIESKKKSKEKHYCVNCLTPVDIDVNICDECKGTEFEIDYSLAKDRFKKIQVQKIYEEEKKKIENEFKKPQQEEQKQSNEEKMTAQEQKELGDKYYYGDGVPQSYEEAVKWYMESAEQGNAWAQNNLGYCYENGYGVEQSYEEAVEWYMKSAEQGNARAQNNLGYCYENGYGVEQSYEEAVKWYMESAEQGYAWAQNNLGYCYENGYGVDQSYEKAVEWYRKAAEQGDADAQYMLGVCYENGYGIEQSYEEAVKWYMESAEQCYACAQNNLGYCYENGYGVEQSYEEAVEWYKKAAEQGDACAQNNLGNCYYNGYGVDQSYEEAVGWYWKAAEQGDADAQYMLSVCYENGYGIEQSYEEALEWYMKSAEQGNARAQNRLSILQKK